MFCVWVEQGCSIELESGAWQCLSFSRCLLLLCWSGACLKLVRVSGFEDSRAYVDVVDQIEFCREENEKVLSCC